MKTEVLLVEVRQRVPELPKAKRARFVQQYQVSPYDAAVLANDLDLASYFEAAASVARKPKSVANWILNDLQNALSIAGKAVSDCPIPPAALDELVAEHREVLVLRYVETMTYEEIAQVVACQVGTVRSRLHYAKRALRDVLERMNVHD